MVDIWADDKPRWKKQAAQAEVKWKMILDESFKAAKAGKPYDKLAIEALVDKKLAS